jgi:LysM repeat protein
MPGSSVALGLTLWASALAPGSVAGLHHAAAAATSAWAEAEAPESKWIKHVIVPGETYADIESRYGVTKKEILRWNKKRLGEKKWLIAGRTLSLQPRRRPPPREKTTYVVRKGDTWSGIAKKFGVDTKIFRGNWNRKAPKRLRAGQVLKAWTNPELVSGEITAEAEGKVPEFSVRGGGFASGRPNRGRLTNGVQLPKSEYYTIRKPERAWATSKASLIIQKSIATFRIKTGYEGEILIADVSQKGGGRLQPHSSHRTGRDADIRLPKLKGVAPGKAPTASEIDWAASWVLLRSFIETGEIEYIFLSYGRQKRLAAAAKAAGATAEYRKEHIQFPKGSGSNKGTIRHSKGHTIHFHVRIKCAKEAPNCQSY